MATRPPNSPSSSPRLPSPPPMAEDQTKPLSPRPGSGSQDLSLGSMRKTDDSSSSRRIRKGTKAVNIAEGPPLVELSEIESAYQLTEHIKALHHSYIHPPNSNTTSPLSRQQATQLSQPPPGVDRQIWLYELCRFLVMKTNTVIVHLFGESPSCSAQTCPEMRASEWQYLCAVHNPPKACCAIDYCCHTLDWAANSVTSPKDFSSRLSLGGEGGVPAQQVKTITNIMRRVYRIFAHAWFSHREMFWKIENKEGLYVFFKTVCDSYNLIPEDNYTIPPEAEGGEPSGTTDLSRELPAAHSSQAPPPPSSILRRPQPRSQSLESEDSSDSTQAATTTLPPGATARRHRHTPSTGAAVEPVMEEAEEDEGLQPPIVHPTPLNTPISPPTVGTTSLPIRSMPREDTQVHIDGTNGSSNTSSASSQATDSTSSSIPELSLKVAAPPTSFPDPLDTSIETKDTLRNGHSAGVALDTSEPPRLTTTNPRPFSPFSPASPKAATVEEMQEEREKEMEREREKEKGKETELEKDKDLPQTEEAQTEAEVEETSAAATDDDAASSAIVDEDAAASVVADPVDPVKSEVDSSVESGKAADDAKLEETASEGEIAGETKAADADEAVKSVED